MLAEHGADSQANSIRQRIDHGGLTFGIASVIVMCFVMNMLDGFDIVAMSVASPNIAEDWALSGEQRGYILSAALVGMTLGAMLLAPLCDRFGRRKMILLSSVATGVSMIVTGLLPPSLIFMILIRVITGLGIGVILASTTAIATEFTPERWRNFAVPFVVSGYPFGCMMVSPVAQYVLPNYGWEYLFILGGVMTLAMSVILSVSLPESIGYMASQAGRKGNSLEQINQALARIGRAPIETIPTIKPTAKTGRVSTILTPDYRTDTLKLWACFFAAFLALYFLVSWIPSLFVASGLTKAQGIHALFFFNLGGVIGIYLLGMLSTRLNLGRTIFCFYLISAISMLYFAFTRHTQLDTLNLIIFIMGFGLHSGFTGMYAIAARVYAVTARATGIGWSIGLGRTGAILSPSIAGLLLTAGWTMYPLFILFAIPILLCAVLITTVKTQTRAA